MSAQLAELLKRLLPSESDKRIRRAIMTAFGSASGVARNVRNQIDIENRTRTGVLINGSVVFNSGIEAEVSGWAWVIDFNISQGADQTLVTVAPDANFVRADFFHADSLGVIYYTPGILDTDGNSIFPVIPDDHLVLTKVFRNPNGTNEPSDPSEPESILDFTEDNVLPMTFGNKLIRSGAKRNIDRFTFDARVKGEPAILPDEFVTFSQLPTPVRYGLLNGGSIQWSGTGLIYHVAPAVYAIGTQYSAPFAIITLNAADPLLPRLDIIGWNTSGQVIYLPGTPAENPVKPQINPETQLEGTLILVPAGALVPEGIVTEVVYDENIEWVASSTGSGTANFASTSNPKEGTLAIEATNVSSGFTIVLTRATVIDLMTFDTLGLWIKLKGSMHSGYGLTYSFRNAVGDLVSNLNTFELDPVNLDYQFVAIPITDVLLLDPQVKSLHISFVRASGPAVFTGFFLDLIALQGGAEQPVVVAGIPEAPINANIYGRGNASWIPLYILASNLIAALEGANAPDGANPFATMADVGSGPGPSTGGLVDLDTFPVLKFDQNYRYSHQMIGPVTFSLSAVVTHETGNFNIIYMQADGTNKPVFDQDDITVTYDGWNNTVGKWNRLRFEFTPSGKAIVQIFDTAGDTNPGSGAITFNLLFDDDYTFEHVISGTVHLTVDITAAEYAKRTIFYFRADGTNKPTWAAPIEANWDNYINEAGVWNRFYLEYTPADKVTLQIINT